MNRLTHALTEQRVILFIVAAVALFGIGLRFWALGSEPFTSAELPFHFAARSVAIGEEGVLPSGESFSRGGPLISVIASLQGVLRSHEAAARIPSAVMGSLAVLIFSGFALLIGGAWAALVATLLIAFYPEAVTQSRTAGLYSFQHLCGVCALAAGWLATSRSSPRMMSSPVDLARRWVWSAVALLFFAMAGLAHLSAASVVAGFGTWVLLLAGLSLWVVGISSLRTNLALQMIALGVVACIALLVVRPDALSAIYGKVTAVQPPSPEISAGAPRSMTFYLNAYSVQFGWLFTLLPLLLLLTIRRYTWLTIYLATWFFVPFLAHSIVIARKEERLLLMATPALFMLGALAASEGREILMRAVTDHARTWTGTYRTVLRLATVLSAIAIGFALATLPAIQQSAGIVARAGSFSAPNWRAVRTLVESEASAISLPLGATDPLMSQRYLDRADFAIGLSLSPAPPGAIQRGGFAKLALLDSVRLEKRSGVPLVTSLKSIRSAFPDTRAILILADHRELDKNVDPSIRNAIAAGAPEICAGRCGSLRLYRLALDGN